MVVRCPVIVSCSTKTLIKEESLTFNDENKPTETYDSIIRRAIKELKRQRTNRIDVSKL
jgi:hypothetical protein